MTAFTTVDINTWPRQKQFDFFKDFEEPFFNVTANVVVGSLRQWAKTNGYALNLAVLFVSQRVINSIPEFRMRIVGDEVRLYEEVQCGSTIFMPDKTFSFCYFENAASMAEFDKTGKGKILHLKQTGDFDPRDEQLNIIHYSTLPWISFSSVKHPRRFSFPDSLPKIVFGKIHQKGGENVIPVSVEAHHALIDGYHIGLYLNGLESAIKNLFQE